MSAASPKKLVIVGASNAEMAKLVRAINRAASPADATWDLIGYLDDDASRKGTTFMDRPILGGVEMILQDRLADVHVVNCVGAPASRRDIAARLAPAADRVINLVHPSVDPWGVTMGVGNLILEGAILGPNTSVGDHTIISFRAFLGHDVTIGSYCNIAPGAILSGRCSAGDGVYVGAGAVLLPGVAVGEGATVGAGSVVTRGVEAGCTVVGNPARVLRRPAQRDAAGREEA
ncbi:MAG: acetyltransferase [Phycisphaerae bacterium]